MELLREIRHSEAVGYQVAQTLTQLLVTEWQTEDRNMISAPQEVVGNQTIVGNGFGGRYEFSKKRALDRSIYK
jgi:hypothetical protein